MPDWLKFWVYTFCLSRIGMAMPTLYERKMCQMILPAVLENTWHTKADNDNVTI